MTTLVARPNRIRDAGQRYQWLVTAHLRLMVLMLVFLGVGSLIGLRLTWLAVFGDPPAASQTGTSFIPVRGDIVDRNGVTLASTMDAWSIGIHPVARITSAAMTAATEPKRSPTTCRTAARMLRLSRSPERNTKNDRTLTPKPAAAIHGRQPYVSTYGQWPMKSRSATYALHPYQTAATTRIATEFVGTSLPAPSGPANKAARSTIFCTTSPGSRAVANDITASAGTDLGSAEPRPRPSGKSDWSGANTMS